MKSIRNSRWFFAFILIIPLLAGCAGQPATQTAETQQSTSQPAALQTGQSSSTDTANLPPKAGRWEGENIVLNVTKDGMVDLEWLIDPTPDDGNDSDTCFIQTSESIPIKNRTAEILAETKTGGIAWDFIVTFNSDTSASLTYTFDMCPSSLSIKFDGNGEVKIFKGDAKANWASAPAEPIVEPTALQPKEQPTITPIPPTPEPSVLIQLGPGKFGKPIWVDVLRGDFVMASGATALTGSSLGVAESWITYPPGMQIDVVGGSVTLKGTAYPDGSKLVVDPSGNLVFRDGDGSAAAADQQTSSLQSYRIPDSVFLLDTRDECNTDAIINGVDDQGFNVGGTLSMHNDQIVLWCPGARHTWNGTFTYEGYTFDSDISDPLVFLVDSQGGYEYIGGKGRVTQPDGQVLDLSGAAASSIEPEGKFSEVLVSDSFDDNSNGWPLGDVNTVYWKGSRSIENGVLDWKGVSRSPMSWYVNPESAVMPDTLSDQLTSVNVKLVNPPMDGTYGLIIRAKELKEGSRFYVLLIDPNGYISFFLNSKDEWTPLLDWQETPGLNPGGWNKLSVEASGSHFRLFLNDNLVGEVDDATLNAGLSGVMIETYNSSVSFDVQFDDFEILLPND